MFSNGSLRKQVHVSKYLEVSTPKYFHSGATKLMASAQLYPELHTK
jgi:hypothetical protein